MIKNQDYIHEFVEEAKSHIEKVEATLLKKEDIRNDSESVNEIFRAVHSIKGTAGFFGLKNIVSLAHTMENIFGEIRNGKFKIDNKIVDTMLLSIDCMKNMVEDVLNSEEADISVFIDELNSIMSDKANDKPEEKSVVVVKGKADQKFSMEGSSSTFLNDGLKHGHRLFEIKLRINKDLLSYSEGPVKLFKKIQSVGMLIDTITDHSEINSLEDILDAISEGQRDVYLGIIITTVLERELLAKAIDIPYENIYELSVEKSEDIKPLDQEEAETPQKAAVSSVASEIEIPANNNIEVNTNKQSDSSKHLKVEDSIRVHVSVLNDLLNMASEMVLGRNQLLTTLEDYRKKIPGLSPILQNIDRLTSEMQEKIMQTRMQPVGNVFSKFPRIIRDLSKSLGKEIELQLEGEDVELDKSVIEALTDPLTHLVRNAADHGLEMPEARKKSGKSGIGIIRLKAFHEGGYVNIDVTDDGSGIDIERLTKKAIEKGLKSKDEINLMSEQELLKLIFSPGFSTAEKLSDISGRGVGMDVVRNNIEKLGGSIEIYTAKAAGTTIRLMLPLTLAIIQSLIVEVEGQKFAIPQVNLKEIVRIKAGDKARRIEFLHDSEVLRLRGRLLPIIRLSDILGIKGNSENNQNRVLRILVLQMGSRRFGMAVDSIFASEETLVKPLPIYLKTCECYSGVTIMGDGKTAMILDVEGIIRLSDLKFREESESIDSKEENDFEKLNEKQNLLLFKCTGNETFAIDLSMISRVEEIEDSDIEKIGNKEYIKFRGDKLRVIRPESYLPVNSGDSKSIRKYVLIPKLVRHPIGILIEKVIDNVNINLKLNSEDSKVEGLLGTAIYDNKIILLINIYELFEKASPENYHLKDMQKASGDLLLVEDTPFFQRQAKEYLEGAGYKVVLAPNGKEALKELEQNTFDAVISDIQMPIMDGLELVKKIRENQTLKHLPVIALTSMSGDSQIKNGLESGFDYYELKLDRDRLLKILQQALKNKVERRI